MNRLSVTMVLLFMASAVQAVISTAGGWINSDTAWDTDTVLVTDTVMVDTGVTLTINPGTMVIFQGTWRIKVMGRLLAVGAQNDSIVFTATDTTANYTGGWTGIRFDGVAPTSDTSRIEFCRLQYARTFGSAIEGYGGAVYVNGFNRVVIAHSTIRNNLAVNGGAGICARFCSPIIRNNDIRNNATSATLSFGGGIFCWSASPLISGNTLRNNRSALDGGGIACQGSSPTIVNNRIEFNTAGNEGGGIRCSEGSSPMIVGNIIRNNTGYDGGGLFANRSTLTVVNSTVINNRASIGPGIKVESSSLQLKGSIVWNNGISSSQASIGAEYSAVQGVMNGSGVINQYPQFTDTGRGDFSLAQGSPCVNRGCYDTAGLKLPVSDILGNPRIHGGRADMGACESQWDSKPEFDRYRAGPAISTLTAREGTLFTLTVHASGFPAPIHSFLTPVPAGLSFDSLTGVLRWTPDSSQADTYSVRILALNSQGTDTAAVCIVVQDGNLEADAGQTAARTLVALIVTNPSRACIVVRYFGAAGTGRVDLIDTRGRVILQTGVSGNGRLVLSTGGLPAGLYLCRFSTRTGVLNRRVAVVK